ncbi:hypothetical protein ABH975_007225 [Bradyrhizobium ottawaense]|uniref:hypothetical protein n=1 Tax=Bradyrhizobium ottawaense TaxID=931866 RepID=UPI003518693E
MLENQRGLHQAIHLRLRNGKNPSKRQTDLFAAALKDGSKLAASSLHAQVNLLKNLANSKTPSDVMKCHLDFAEQFWSKSFSKG